MIYHLLNWYFEGEPYAYQNVMFRSTMAILTAFVVSIFLGPRIIRFQQAYSHNQHPEPRPTTDLVAI